MLDIDAVLQLDRVVGHALDQGFQQWGFEQIGAGVTEDDTGLVFGAGNARDDRALASAQMQIEVAKYRQVGRERGSDAVLTSAATNRQPDLADPAGWRITPGKLTKALDLGRSHHLAEHGLHDNFPGVRRGAGEIIAEQLVDRKEF